MLMLSNTLKTIITFCLAGQAMKQTHVAAAQTRVAIYRGPATLEGTPESAADLFTSAWKDSKITYVGPKERVKITKETLKDFDVYIQPGGGDLSPAWRDVKKYQKTIQDFVAGGGHYLGFCLGAYLAGPDEGFNLFPSGVRADREVDQRNSQVDDEENTVIHVDWTFSSGSKQCKTEKNRWLYFQDGAAILGKVGKNGNKGKVLGRYSKSKDVAAYVVGYKKGIVGVVGPHPEADKTWYDVVEIENPTGYDLDVGRDFVRAVMEYKEGEKPCGSC